MKVSDCPNCGGSDLYRSLGTASANAWSGPNLLPHLQWDQFRVVVCRECGLTRLFASPSVRQDLAGGNWERLVGGAGVGPLGL